MRSEKGEEEEENSMRRKEGVMIRDENDERKIGRMRKRVGKKVQYKEKEKKKRKRKRREQKENRNTNR